MQIVGSPFIGTRILLTGYFRRAGDNVTVDPFDVKVNARKPGGLLMSFGYTTAAEINRVSAGVYEFRYVLDTPGRWWFGWEAFGAGSAVIADQEISVLAQRRPSVAA